VRFGLRRVLANGREGCRVGRAGEAALVGLAGNQELVDVLRQLGREDVEKAGHRDSAIRGPVAQFKCVPRTVIRLFT
jgi:hypothetical protein